MAQVNINKKIADPYYRYKMPRLVAKVEGKGNGIKTVVMNMSDIAKSLHMPPAYPTKYIGIELGAQVIMDKKNERYVINGAHDDIKLQNLLYEFIEKYLLCPKCDNPETDLIIQNKKEKIKVICKACGYHFLIGHSHRLNTYIIKNPPLVDSKKDHTSNQKEVTQEDKRISTPNGTIETGDTQWLTDTSQIAVEHRMSELSKRAAELTLNSDLEKSIEERLKMFMEFSRKIYAEIAPDIELIFHESNRLDLGETAIIAIAEVIFTDVNVLKKIKTNRDLLIRFCTTDRAQRNLLGSIELVIVRFPEITPQQILNIFKLLYHFDIVDEEVFLAWGERRSKRFLVDISLVDKVHAAVDPFIDWLRTTDEESEDEQVEFIASANPVPTVGKYAPIPEQIDEDINIDDI